MPSHPAVPFAPAHRWSRTQGAGRVPACAGLAALVLLAVLLSGVAGEVGGLVQRAFIALVFAWPVLLAALPGRSALP
jgi:hypothetical protein